MSIPREHQAASTCRPLTVLERRPVAPGSGGRCKKCDVIRNSSEKGWIVWFGTTGLLMLVAVGYFVAVVKASFREVGSSFWS